MNTQASAKIPRDFTVTSSHGHESPLGTPRGSLLRMRKLRFDCYRAMLLSVTFNVD